MNLLDDILGPLGGISKNNLSDILHLNEEEFRYELETQMHFKLSPYYDIDSLDSYCSNNLKNLNVMSFNSESIFAKHDMLKLLIEMLKNRYNFHIHVITVQEAWLERGKSLASLEIDNYKLFPQYESIGSKKGGIVVYVHNSISGKEIDFFKESPSKLWEGHTLEINGPMLSRPFRLHTIYRPPREYYDTFLNEFEPYLMKIKSDPIDSILVGDTNFNLLEASSNQSIQNYLDAMISHELIPQITVPTKINKNSCKLYDHIFTHFKSDNILSSSCVYISDMSDHFPVMISLKRQKRYTDMPKYKIIRDTSTANYKKYLSKLADYVEKTYFDYDLTIDPNINNSKLSDLRDKAYNESFPVKSVKITKYNTKLNPWITYGLLNSIKKKDNLYKIMIKTNRNAPSYEKKVNKYKNFVKILNKLIRKTKSDYYTNEFNKFANDCKNTWKLINEATGRKIKKQDLPNYFKKIISYKDSTSNEVKSIEIKIENQKTIADEFNQYFANIGLNLSSKIQYKGVKNIASFMKKTISSQFEFETVTNQNVLDCIGTLEPKNSCSYDGMSPKELIQIAPIIHPILRLIINQSLITGIFPTKFKIAVITPLYKGKNADVHAFGNYRPISLLPTLSKIIEKIVHAQLYKYMSENNHFIASQYGFRRNHSTEYAAMEFVDKTMNAIDKQQVPLAILMDFSKAFDTLDHKILLDKLKYYGIQGIALTWFENYLTGMTQYVQFNGINSNLVDITTGVPQGSVLGPLLFLIYINDLPNASKIFHAILFADDTSLTATICSFSPFQPKSKLDFQILSRRINIELEMINEWLQINKLSLNVDKTKYMIFHNRQRNMDIYKQLNIKINDLEIKRVFTFNFLGIIINDKLDWNDHINYVAQKILPVINTLNRLKHLLPIRILKMIYNSLILSRLHYGNILWGNNQGRLNKLQKRAIRAISNVGTNSHTVPILKKLHLLTLSDIHCSKLLCLYKQYIDGKLPTNIYNMFSSMSDSIHVQNLPTYPRTAGYRHTIRYELQTYIYTAPNELVNKAFSTSYNSFKWNIKEYILDRYNSLCTKVGCRACNLHVVLSY